MMITSPVFAHQQAIPAQYTCDGEDYSPALEWSHVPKEAKSLALVCEDPDASMGNWIHWLVVNIPAQCTGIPENGPLPEGALALKNSWGKTSYGGPCPPSGRHRYFFKLYALKVESLEGATAANFRQLIARYSLAQSELMGTYQRAK
ncbi:YbhB/YbcL family Raf kinase inhibitor-like protein [candidate division FCPU426 bacterium]|nr:YbhB/YbcL family Raf kinase inhibitor-like protein [candidate division FCPU426 bacterium]